MAYLATALSSPSTFTATSMKLFDSGFSIPLRITYTRPSCPTNFLLAPNCEIADRVSFASFFLSKVNKSNLQHLRLHISLGSFALWANTYGMYFEAMRAVRQPVSPSRQNSDAFPFGATAHDGCLAVLLQFDGEL
jgi:hypothetical protein